MINPDRHLLNKVKTRVRPLASESTFINGQVGMRDIKTGRNIITTDSGGSIPTQSISVTNGKPYGSTIEVDLTNTARWSDG